MMQATDDILASGCRHRVFTGVVTTAGVLTPCMCSSFLLLASGDIMELTSERSRFHPIPPFTTAQAGHRPLFYSPLFRIIVSLCY